jgi:hypothetical protein
MSVEVLIANLLRVAKEDLDGAEALLIPPVASAHRRPTSSRRTREGQPT